MTCFFTLRDSFQINIEALFCIFGCFSKNCISTLSIIKHPVLNERPPLSYQKYWGTKSTQAPWVLLKSNHSGMQDLHTVLCSFLETYKENLSNNQELLEYAISSYTLVITNFNSGVLLLGEIRCLSVSMFPTFFYSLDLIQFLIKPTQFPPSSQGNMDVEVIVCCSFAFCRV